VSRSLTASDRKSLIRLASTLPKGSPERKVILAGLIKAASMDDFSSRIANRDFIDVDREGRGKGSPKAVLDYLGFDIAVRLDKKGKAFIRDNNDLIGPALSENSLRHWLSEYLYEEAGYVGEVAEDEAGMRAYKEALRKAKEAGRARIKVESVTSPRTGDKGYRVTWLGHRGSL